MSSYLTDWFYVLSMNFFGCIKLNHKSTELRGKSNRKAHNHIAKPNEKTHKKKRIIYKVLPFDSD